jgi:hypothetical protein
MKHLLNILETTEITIDTRYVDQTMTIDPDERNFFEIKLVGDMHERDERKWLDASIEFSYLTIDGIEYEWTDEHKLAVYEILKEKFSWQFDYLELNY